MDITLCQVFDRILSLFMKNMIIISVAIHVVVDDVVIRLPEEQ